MSYHEVLANSPCLYFNVWRGGGLMVSVLASGSSGPGSSPGLEHCAMGKTLSTHGASLHSGLKMDTGEFNARG